MVTNEHQKKKRLHMTAVAAHDEYIKTVFDSSNIFSVQQSLLQNKGIIYYTAC